MERERLYFFDIQSESGVNSSEILWSLCNMLINRRSRIEVTLIRHLESYLHLSCIAGINIPLRLFHPVASLLLDFEISIE